MTTIYVPKMLSSELTRFKDNNGNILLDYRSAASGTKKVLNTPYDPLSEDTITAAIAPLEVTGTHVSGDDNNFRTISIDLAYHAYLWEWDVNTYQSTCILCKRKKSEICSRMR